jgi:hypothetical protein
MQVHVEPSLEKLQPSLDLDSLTKVRANPFCNFFNLADSDSVRICKIRQNSCLARNRAIQNFTGNQRKVLQLGTGLILKYVIDFPWLIKFGNMQKHCLLNLNFSTKHFWENSTFGEIPLQ